MTSLTAATTIDLASLAKSRRESLVKINQNFEEIQRGIEDVVCSDHTKLKTIYIDNHPDTPGKGGFICDYCPNPTSKMKFYSQILIDYAEAINQIKRAAEQKNSIMSRINASEVIEQCSELSSQVEFSNETLKNLFENFDQFFLPGVFAKIAASEELLKLNEILKTISFNEKGKPIYESIGNHPERETQYVKLAKILISFKNENFDMNQKFSVILQEFIKRIIQSRFAIEKQTSLILNFLTSDFYEFILRLDGLPVDDEFRSGLKYLLFYEDEWLLQQKRLVEVQELYKSEVSLRIKLEEEFKISNAGLLRKLQEYEAKSEMAFAQAGDQEALFKKRFDNLQADYEFKLRNLNQTAEADKTGLLKRIEILELNLRQSEEKLNFAVQQNKTNISIKIEESESSLRSMKNSYDELKRNFDLQAQKMKSQSDELEELRIKHSDAIVSRKNLVEYITSEKIILQSILRENIAENAERKQKLEIDLKSESIIVSLNANLQDLNAKLSLTESRLNTEVSLNKSLYKEKVDLEERIKLMSIEITSLSVKICQESEGSKQYLDLTSLNGSLLSDLKKQININKTLELTVQELQEKINYFNCKVHANELLIRQQLEVIGRYADNKVLIPVETNCELLVNSKKETNMIIERIERLERDPLYKSVIINMPASDNTNINTNSTIYRNNNTFKTNFESNSTTVNLLDSSSYARSIVNSAFRPSSPVVNSSFSTRLNNHLFQNNNYTNSIEDLKSPLVSNANAVNFRATTTNQNNKIISSLTNKNSVVNNKEAENSSNIQHKRSSSVHYVRKQPLKINFSSDLLLNNKNWETIRKWIESTDIFSNPIQPKLLYKATRDGFSYKEFQKRCLGLKNTLVIAKTSLEKVIGGFTPLAWIVPNELYVYLEDPTNETFLFSVDLDEKLNLKPKQYAICLSQKNGPIFGGGSDFEIVDLCNSQFNNSSNIGNSFYYSKTADSFYGSEKYLISEYEVYQII